MIADLADYPNLVILHTFSKAWGLASLRLGMCFASKDIIGILNKIKPPYNINGATQQLALDALSNLEQVNDMTKTLVKEREALAENLKHLPIVEKVYPSDANFLLVKMTNAEAIFNYLRQRGIIVRDRSKMNGCEGCLRLTVGTPAENETLLKNIQQFIDEHAEN